MLDLFTVPTQNKIQQRIKQKEFFRFVEVKHDQIFQICIKLHDKVLGCLNFFSASFKMFKNATIFDTSLLSLIFQVFFLE